MYSFGRRHHDSSKRRQQFSCWYSVTSRSVHRSSTLPSRTARSLATGSSPWRAVASCPPFPNLSSYFFTSLDRCAFSFASSSCCLTTSVFISSPKLNIILCVYASPFSYSCPACVWRHAGLLDVFQLVHLSRFFMLCHDGLRNCKLSVFIYCLCLQTLWKSASYWITI